MGRRINEVKERWIWSLTVEARAVTYGTMIAFIATKLAGVIPLLLLLEVVHKGSWKRELLAPFKGKGECNNENETFIKSVDTWIKRSQ